MLHLILGSSGHIYSGCKRHVYSLELFAHTRMNFSQLQTMETILKNAISTIPQQEEGDNICDNASRTPLHKYRRINCANPNFFQRVGRFRQCVEVLVLAGFREESDDTLTLREANKNKLSAVLDAVSAEAERASEDARNTAIVEAKEEEERRNISAMVRESMRQKKDQEASVSAKIQGFLPQACQYVGSSQILGPLSDPLVSTCKKNGFRKNHAISVHRPSFIALC
jgi:hypothetical protein